MKTLNPANFFEDLLDVSCQNRWFNLLYGTMDLMKQNGIKLEVTSKASERISFASFHEYIDNACDYTNDDNDSESDGECATSYLFKALGIYEDWERTHPSELIARFGRQKWLEYKKELKSELVLSTLRSQVCWGSASPEDGHPEDGGGETHIMNLMELELGPFLEYLDKYFPFTDQSQRPNIEQRRLQQEREKLVDIFQDYSIGQENRDLSQEKLSELLLVEKNIEEFRSKIQRVAKELEDHVIGDSKLGKRYALLGIHRVPGCVNDDFDSDEEEDEEEETPETQEEESQPIVEFPGSGQKDQKLHTQNDSDTDGEDLTDPDKDNGELSDSATVSGDSQSTDGSTEPQEEPQKKVSKAPNRKNQKEAADLKQACQHLTQFMANLESKDPVDAALADTCSQDIEPSVLQRRTYCTRSSPLGMSTRQPSLTSSACKPQEQSKERGAHQQQSPIVIQSQESPSSSTRKRARRERKLEEMQARKPSRRFSDPSKRTSAQNQANKKKFKLTDARPSAHQVDFEDSASELSLSTPPTPKTFQKLNRNTRGRRKWTAEEEESLRKGVQRFGIGAWADIHKTFNFNCRTQVDLKDKWRNMEKKERR